MEATQDIPLSTDRKSQRHRCYLECQVVTDNESFKLLGDEARDVSLGGMLLKLGKRLENAGWLDALLGQRVLFSLRLPNSKIWVDGEGRVARIIKGRRSTKRRLEAQSLGIEIVQMDGFDRLMLEQRIESLPPPMPAREAKLDYATYVAMAAQTSPGFIFDL